MFAKIVKETNDGLIVCEKNDGSIEVTGEMPPSDGIPYPYTRTQVYYGYDASEAEAKFRAKYM